MISQKKGLKILKRILYTKNFNREIKEDVDVILSPEFYWIKKIEVPIKNIFQAKKIAKNMFDLEGDYFFDAIKIRDKFFAIAIDKNLKLNIPKKYINSIRLAQVEFFEFECINLEKEELKKINDIFFILPSKDKNCPKIEEVLSKIKLSNYKISLNKVEIDKKVFIALGLIIIYFIFGIIAYKKELNILEEKKEKLKQYNLPTTLFQLNSIYNNLILTDKYQNLIRNSLEFISKTPLKQNEYFLELSFNKFFIVKIKTNRNLDFYFKRYFKVVSNIKNGIYIAKLYK